MNRGLVFKGAAILAGGWLIALAAAETIAERQSGPRADDEIHPPRLPIERVR